MPIDQALQTFPVPLWAFNDNKCQKRRQNTLENKVKIAKTKVLLFHSNAIISILALPKMVNRKLMIAEAEPASFPLFSIIMSTPKGLRTAAASVAGNIQNIKLKAWLFPNVAISPPLISMTKKEV